MTPFLSASQSSLSQCQRNNVTGCARYPVKALYPHDTDSGRFFFFQLHVINAAGHVTTVNTSSVRLPAHYPPSHAVILDVLETMITLTTTPSTSSPVTTDTSTTDLTTEGSSTTDLGSVSATQRTTGVHIETQETPVLVAQFSKDVDVITQREEVCVAWSGFYHPEEISVEIGLGTSPHHDDVIAFHSVESENPVCLNITSLPVYTKIFSIVRATSSGGTSVFSSDGFSMIPQSDPDNQIMVFNGRGCHGSNVMEGQEVDSSTSSINFGETLELSIHAGDFLFAQFSPFVPNVTFDNAILLQTTLTGYQVVATSSNITAHLPLSMAANSSVQVQHCQKDSPILPVPDSHVTVTWEMAGPWTQFTRYLEVVITDKTCLDASVKNNQYLHKKCLLYEEKVEMMTREMKLYNNKVNNFIIRDHSYVAFVSPCFDDKCLPAVSSGEVTYTNTYTVDTRFAHATLSDVSTQLLTVDVLASVESENHGNLSCLYQWAVSTDISGARLITDWVVQTALTCSNIEVLLIRHPFQMTFFLTSRPYQAYYRIVMCLQQCKEERYPFIRFVRFVKVLL